MARTLLRPRRFCSLPYYLRVSADVSGAHENDARESSHAFQRVGQPCEGYPSCGSRFPVQNHSFGKSKSRFPCSSAARTLRRPAANHRQPGGVADAALPRHSGQARGGAVDDPLEQEADRVAEQVMRMPDPTAAIDPQEPHASSKDLARHPTASDHGPLVQRECACGGSCDKCQAEQSDDEHEKARRKPDALQISRVASSAASTGMEVPPIVHEVLSSPGQPLDAEYAGVLRA